MPANDSGRHPLAGDRAGGTVRLSGFDGSASGERSSSPGFAEAHVTPLVLACGMPEQAMWLVFSLLDERSFAQTWARARTAVKRCDCSPPDDWHHLRPRRCANP
jgi:hypothetical protein